MPVKNIKYAGMKKNPYENSPKNAVRKKETEKKRKKKANGSVTSRKGLSAYQIRTQEEFMKVRPGETKEQWLIRTRYRRIRTEDELALTVNGRRELQKRQAKQNKRQKNSIQIRVRERNFNFLKYYVFVINWASIKYNIPQQDLEIGFHFYDKDFFVKDEFINKCLLFSNTSANVFNRFKKEGYIVERLSTMGVGTEKKQTGLYKFTTKFTNILTAVYEKVAYQSNFNYRVKGDKEMSPELEKLILEMAQENQDIITGKKEPDNFAILK